MPNAISTTATWSVCALAVRGDYDFMGDFEWKNRDEWKETMLPEFPVESLVVETCMGAFPNEGKAVIGERRPGCSYHILPIELFA